MDSGWGCFEQKNINKWCYDKQHVETALDVVGWNIKWSNIGTCELKIIYTTIILKN